MRTYPKWVRKIKLVALYGGGGCFGLFVILFIVIVATSDNEKAGSGSAPESPAVVASGHTGATGADPAETEASRGGAPSNLFEAAEGGTVSEVKALIKGGANPRARDKYLGATPLHYAVQYANPAVVLALIEAGADAKARDDTGFTPLHRVGNYEANPAVVRALIESGADAGARTDSGFTPLTWIAAYTQTPSMIKALIKGGADPNARGGGATPLHWAVRNPYEANPAVIVALIEGGANPGARDDDGNTPFDYAKDNDALKGTDAYRLLKAATDSAHSEPSAAQAALIEAATDGTASEVRAARAAGADYDTRDENGNMPVHLAAAFNPDPAVILPLIAFVNPESVNHAGMTALMLAAKNNPNPAVILAILDAGADPGALNPQNDRDAYYYAVKSSNYSNLHGTEALRRLKDGRY